MHFKSITPELLLQAADALSPGHTGADFMCFAIEEAVCPGRWNVLLNMKHPKPVTGKGRQVRRDFCELLEMHGVDLGGGAFTHNNDNQERFMFLEFLSYWLEDQESL